LAEHWAHARGDKKPQNLEIISVDSALVYRGMDIGTAKPSAQELAQVRHHLIDVRDPLQTYSAAEFVQDATALIVEIRARGACPVLVGGTMLYLKALQQGLAPMPPADAQVRAAIEAQAQAEGWPAVHAELAQVDPLSAQRLAPNDSQRVQRALEVYRLSGRTLSQWHAEPLTTAQTMPLHLLSLEPQDRPWLHQRIAQRFDAMLAQGFLDEVRALRARGDLHPDLPSMRCVGYRQAWEALDLAQSTGQPVDMNALRDKGIFATRQLAKRQITWLRSMPERHAIACDDPKALSQLLAAVDQLDPH
jgi:tRNA dimethylallyltransferase